MSEERWILVSDGTPQAMYAGKTTLSEEEIDKVIANGQVLELKECRVMRTILAPSLEDPGGLSVSELLAPLSVARGAIRYKVKPKGYFWPDEHKATYRVLLKKIEPVEKAELKHRAKEAGLVTPDGMRTGPGGKLIS